MITRKKSLVIEKMMSDVNDTLSSSIDGTYYFPLNNTLSKGLLDCIFLLQELNGSVDDFLQCDNETNGTLQGYFSQHAQQNRPFVLPWWQQLIWGILFLIMTTVATFGNSLVIWIVACHRRMRTVTNFFLLNLSIADLTMATFNAIFNFVFMLESHWPFGSVYCTVNNFIANLTVATSVFTITAMSFDRYIAIVHPLTPRMSRTVITLVISGIWMCAGLLSLPTMLYSTTITYDYADDRRTICFLVWPDGVSGESLADYVYNILFLLLTYVVPILSMAVTYTRIGHVLWGSKGIGEATELQKQGIKSKQKVVRMLIAVVVLFAICWLPYHLYFLYTYHHREIVHWDYVQHVYLSFYWLAMSNSMYNPIIYCWLNKRFRSYFRQTLCFCLPSEPRESLINRTSIVAQSSLEPRGRIRLTPGKRPPRTDPNNGASNSIQVAEL